MALPSSKISPTGNYRQQPNKALISTKAFNSEFFSYSTYVDSSFNTRGTLVVNGAATASLCPAGRILHANGKILTTGVNPDLTVGGTTYTYLMGVLDSVTGLNGYINPASATFANYDVNLPVQYDGGNQAIVPALGGQGAKLQVGPATLPVAIFTAVTNITGGTENRINVTAVAQGVILAGALISGAGIPAGATVSAYGTSSTTGTGGTGTYIISANATAAATITAVASQLSGGATQNARDSCIGQFVMDGSGTTTVSTNACTATSYVFLQQLAGDITSVPLVAPAVGSFVVTSATAVNGGAYSFLIVN